MRRRLVHYVDKLFVSIPYNIAHLTDITPFVGIVVDEALTDGVIVGSGYRSETRTANRSDNIDIQLLTLFDEISEIVVVVACDSQIAERVAVRQDVALVKRISVARLYIEINCIEPAFFDFVELNVDRDFF